jgi:hypothetical protein
MLAATSVSVVSWERWEMLRKALVVSSHTLCMKSATY